MTALEATATSAGESALPASAPTGTSTAWWSRLARRRTGAVGVLLVWVVASLLFRNRATLDLDASQLTWLHLRLNDLNDAIGASRDSNPFLLYVVDGIRVAVDAMVEFVQQLIAQPATGRPVPQVGWLGVVAIGTWVAGAVGNLRVAALTAGALVFIGLQGLWQQGMDTLALTLSAVALALLAGIPIGVAAGVNDRVHRFITPALDVAQTMPTFVYLAPLTLFFLIGPASAAIVTIIYAMPPVIRLTAHGIRAVPAASLEASTSLGATGRQRLLHVLLPMARRSVVLGVNQTIMAALSMVTIAALIDAPGLGQTVLQALQTLDVGVAFNAGLAIVLLAIVLDRVTTAAAARTERRRQRSTTRRRLRWVALAVTGGGVLALLQLSRTYLWAAEFPTTLTVGGTAREVGIGGAIARGVGGATDWVQNTFNGPTNALKDGVTRLLVDPLQVLLAGTPWMVVAAAITALAALAAGRRAARSAAVCLGLLLLTGLWSDAMATLATTLVATAAVMVLGLAVGVWMGRNPAVDRTVRPVLDAAQTMPAFVYLVPFVALFAASRFTAIVAAVVFAAPVAIKIVADGVRGVPAASVEAATAAGSNRRQVILKVQLPMARPALALALNQGMIYVLSMVVVGGLVGAGALGYDVVAGFSQGQLFGKGLAAGAAIVLLGIMLDRVTQAAAQRAARTPGTPASTSGR